MQPELRIVRSEVRQILEKVGEMIAWCENLEEFAEVILAEDGENEGGQMSGE